MKNNDVMVVYVLETDLVHLCQVIDQGMMGKPPQQTYALVNFVDRTPLLRVTLIDPKLMTEILLKGEKKQ